jgi:hypothetical protein
MIDGERIAVLSIEELILALEPVDATAIQSDDRRTMYAQLRRMKNNMSAVLAFTSSSFAVQSGDDPELRYLVDQLRGECLLINGMISKLMLRRFAFLDTVKYAQNVLDQYEEMAGVACRMCMMLAPQSGNNLARAFS